jgi:hypothetical protein
MPLLAPVIQIISLRIMIASYTSSLIANIFCTQ